MVTSTDNWLDSLVKHPIFETDQKQRVDIAEHTNNVEQFILQHHICILTMRDNDLFVAVGSKIRVLNLTEFKEAHNKSSDDDYSALSSVHYKVTSLSNNLHLVLMHNICVVIGHARN